MRKILLLILATVLIAACGKTDNNKHETTDETQLKSQVVEINLAEFKTKAPELVGKEIAFTGLVDHTCKHSGKRMFLVDKNSDATLKVEAGKNFSRFDEKLTGNMVKVIGLVKEKKVDMDYLNKWEKDILNKIESNKNLHLGTHENGEKQEDEAQETLNKIKELKKKLQNSGKEYLSFYSVECVSYKVINEKE